MNKQNSRDSSGDFFFQLGENFEKRVEIFKTIFSPGDNLTGLYLKGSLFGKQIILIPENLYIDQFELKKSGKNLCLRDNSLDFVFLQDLPYGRRETFLLKESFRVLKNGGTLFLLITNLPVRIFLKAIFLSLSSVNYRTLVSRIGFRYLDTYMVYPNFSRTNFMIPIKKQAALLAGLSLIKNHSKGILGQVKDLIVLAFARLRIFSFLVPHQALIVTK